MKSVTLEIPDYVYDFYRKVGQTAGGFPAERVMTESLFRLAGNLSENAITALKRRKEP